MRWSSVPALARLPLVPLLALGLLFPGSALAAPPACAPDLVGSWTGKVWDQGRFKELRTRFSTDSGELTGSYHVEEEDGDAYDGTLSDFAPTASCAGSFRWHDRYGDGVVQVEFRPERDRFDGEWGVDAPLKNHIFNGRRFRPVPIG